MALRILLADESLNIKKNLQLALQDYGVEVKTLINGDEVLSTVQSYQPDIVFLDILLSKISGYDACSQIKNSPHLQKTPVILTWSNFMELDENKAQQCRSDGRIEKPFDRDQLRKLIHHFVPKTRNQALSEFLTLPPQSPSAPSHSPSPAATSAPAFSPSHADVFTSEKSLRSTPEISPLTSLQDDGGEDLDDWSQKSLSQHPFSAATSFASGSVSNSSPDSVSINATSNLSKPQQTTSPVHTPEYDVEIADIQIDDNDVPSSDILESTAPKNRRHRPHPMLKDRSHAGVSIAPLSIDEKHLQEIIRTQIHETVQHWVRKLVPEIAERVIRSEIDRLMVDLDKDSGDGGPP